MLNIWHWLMLPDVTGAVTWLGTIAGLIGLGFTYNEVRKGRRASERAARAVAASERRMSIGGYAYAYAQVGLVRDLVDAGDFRPASPIFQALKRFVHEVRPTASTEGDNISPSPIGHALRTVEFQLSNAIRKEKYDVRKILRSLSQISDHLSELERKSKYPEEGDDYEVS